MRRHQAGAGERGEHVVDVVETSGESGVRTDQGVGVGVRVGVHRAQALRSGVGDAQVGTAEHLLEVQGRRHDSVLPLFWNESRSRRGDRAREVLFEAGDRGGSAQVRTE